MFGGEGRKISLLSVKKNYSNSKQRIFIMDKKLLKILLVAGMVTALTNTDVKADRELVATCPNSDGFIVGANSWTIQDVPFTMALLFTQMGVAMCQYGNASVNNVQFKVFIPEDYNRQTCSFVKDDPVGKVTTTCPSKTSTECSVYCEKTKK